MASYMSNSKLAESIGQGKSSKDVMEVYESNCGKYNCDASHQAKLPANKVKGSVYESLPFQLKK